MNSRHVPPYSDFFYMHSGDTDLAPHALAASIYQRSSPQKGRHGERGGDRKKNGSPTVSLCVFACFSMRYMCVEGCLHTSVHVGMEARA